MDAMNSHGNDDELITAVRRTLHARAEAVVPRPGTMPAPTSPAAKPPYLRPVVLVSGALLAAAAITAALLVPGSPHRTNTLEIVTPPTTVSTPATTLAPTPPTTLPTPTTAPPARQEPLPTGFVPLSVSFVSAERGWVLGDVDNAGPVYVGCTDDGGSTWQRCGAPETAVPGPGFPLQVRFADPSDGWVYEAGYQQSGPVLWSTHDGGAHWSAVPDPAGQGATPLDLEADAGRAYLVAVTDNPSPSEELLSTPATADHWTVYPATLPLGAGPVPEAQIVFQGGNGWIVDQDRTVIGGLEMNHGSAWLPWTPPCRTAGGPGVLAAASPTDLVAVCVEGEWGTGDPGTTPGQAYLFTSNTGKFVLGGPVTGARMSVASVSSPPGDPQTVVVATGAVLMATFDGGRSWHAVYGPADSSEATFVGFTTAEQGVALFQGSMAITRDGGHTWSRVNL